jgi:hypothetical protein
MHREGTGEGLDRRQKPLLEADPNNFRAGAPARSFGVEASAAQLPVLRQLGGEHQLRSRLGQAIDDDRFDAALRKALSKEAQILLQTSHHDRLELSPARSPGRG